jgi:RNA polymerase sigma factor (sigma-70 family)
MTDLTREQQLETAERFLPALVRIARRYTSCLEDAEDAAQTAVLRLMEAQPQVVGALRTEPQVRKWLKTTAIRLCADTYRRAPSFGLLARLFASALDLEADVADGVCTRAEATWLTRVAETLPKRHRLVAEVFMAGGGVAEVQERCGVTYDAAEHMVRDTRARLRRAVIASRVAAVVFGYRRVSLRLGTSREQVALPAMMLAVVALVLPAAQRALRESGSSGPSRPGQEQVDASPTWSDSPRTPAPGVTALPAHMQARSRRAEQRPKPGELPRDRWLVPALPTIPGTPSPSPSPRASEDASPLDDVVRCLREWEITPTHVGC